MSSPPSSTAARSASRPRSRSARAKTPPRSQRASRSRSTLSTLPPRAGSWTTSSSSRTGWYELKETMRNLFLLLISFAGLVRAEAPPNIELTFSLTRNGSHMAEVTEKLEYSGGNYQLTEIWKGKGLYALMGQARRVSRGTIERDTLRPREFGDERSPPNTPRAWLDLHANTLTMQYN